MTDETRTYAIRQYQIEECLDTRLQDCSTRTPVESNSLTTMIHRLCNLFRQTATRAITRPIESLHLTWALSVNGIEARSC